MKYTTISSTSIYILRLGVYGPLEVETALFYHKPQLDVPATRTTIALLTVALSLAAAIVRSSASRLGGSPRHCLRSTWSLSSSEPAGAPFSTRKSWKEIKGNQRKTMEKPWKSSRTGRFASFSGVDGAFSGRSAFKRSCRLRRPPAASFAF